jgi:predicted O-methyltransferase YrrM
VYNHFQLGFKYLSYYLTASNGKGHGTHSPFIFHFINKILNDKKHYAEYDKVEKLRSWLLKNQTVLTVEDFGAGSSASKTNKRTVASIAKNAAKPKKFGQLLFRMVKEYQPKTILELGTSLGITTSYLSLARPEANIITMEGAGEVAAGANRNFKELGSGNVTIVQGDFDKSLSSVLKGLSSVDLAFIDGNHRQLPTEKYFCQLLSKSNNDSIFIFDDIHWSKEMEAAWKTIKNHPSARCTVDLFFIGIVFFRPEFHEKQHFTIRY